MYINMFIKLAYKIAFYNFSSSNNVELTQINLYNSYLKNKYMSMNKTNVLQEVIKYYLNMDEENIYNGYHVIILVICLIMLVGA